MFTDSSGLKQQEHSLWDHHILEINTFKVYEGKGDCFVAWRYSEEALSENDP